MNKENGLGRVSAGERILSIGVLEYYRGWKSDKGILKGKNLEVR